MACSRCCWSPAERALTQDYAAQIEAWRVDREEKLKADDGWLTVAGLFFLNEGDNSFGSSPLNDIVLRTGARPCGRLQPCAAARSRRGRRRERPSPSMAASVAEARLWPREGDERPVVSIGPLTLYVHYSGPRLAIRLRDLDSELRRRFTGLRWFPVDESYRVRGRYVPHDQPRTVELSNILGDIEPARSSGSVVLTVGGEELRMTALDVGGRLWFVFRDLTSGRETYSAARFLYADTPVEDGYTTVDFNRAYNPPCAFNPYTTCPLPPRENRLPVRIEAGERDYQP